MNIHEDIALLDSYVDGEVTPQTSADVEDHLARCPACRAYVEEALALRQAFSALAETEVPEGFARRVMERVAQSPRRKGQPWGKLAAAAACLAVLALVQYFTEQKAAAPMTAGSASVYATTAPNGIADEESEAVLERRAPAAGNGAVAQMGEEDGSTADEASPKERESILMYSGQTAPAAGTLTVAAPDIGQTLAALLPDTAPEEIAPGFVRYRLERQRIETVFAALEDQGVDLPEIPAEGTVFYLEGHEE